MKQRCSDPNCSDYKYYGGRGIYVCEEWKTSFQTFVDDMGSRPHKFTLDRKENNGPYCKENCRWASRLEQVMNSRKVTKAKGYYKLGNGWQAKIQYNGTKLSKYFDSEIEAKEWYENNQAIRTS